MKKHLLLSLGLILWGATMPALHAADPDAEAAKMREALRSTMLQLRDAQNQIATTQLNLDTLKAQSEKTEKDLTDKNDALTKQLADVTQQRAVEKAAADKAKADADAKIADQASQITQFEAAIAKWTDGFNKAVAVAREKETERAKLASQVILMQRQIDDDLTRNVKLYQVGSEVLTRYEKFGLGEALEAKEPFVGSTRTELETLVQQYEDRMRAQKIPIPNLSPQNLSTASTTAAH